MPYSAGARQQRGSDVPNGHLVAASEARYVPRVRVYGIVREQASETVELFVDRADAEAFVAEVESDDPELAALLRVEPIELNE